jgi:hypothetical protein
MGKPASDKTSTGNSMVSCRMFGIISDQLPVPRQRNRLWILPTCGVQILRGTAFEKGARPVTLPI